MNSKQLQELHPEVYEKFFQQHEMVFSCPFVFDLSGNTQRAFGCPKIYQKAPLRFYVGISPSSGGLQFGKLSYYDISMAEFVSQDISESGKKFEVVTAELQRIYGQHNFKIDTLSELSPSLNLGGDISALVLMSLMSFCYINKEIDIDVLYEIKKSPVDSIVQSYGSLVRTIFDKSRDLLNLAYGGPIINFISQFFDGSYPFIRYYDDHDNRDPSLEKEGKLLVNSNYHYFRINDLWPEVKISNSLSFDISILYSGKVPVVKDLSRTDLLKLEFQDIKEELLEKFTPFCDSLSQDQKPKFYKSILQKPLTDIPLLYGSTHWLTVLEAMYLFKEVLGDNYSDHKFQRLVASLNNYNLTHYFLQDYLSEDFIKVMEQLRSYVDTTSKSIAVFPESRPIGGCIIAISPLESVRKKIEQFITDYEPRSCDNNLALIYSSWKDGLESEGFRIDQDISAGIYSPFSKNTNYKLINRDGSSFFKNYQNSIEDRGNDILVDGVRNKIYIQGKVCDSKDLITQTATAEVLAYLVEHQTNTVSSKALSPSSYSKGKNDMIAKVINPLIKLIQKRFNKLITVTYTGYGSNYSIEVDFKGLKVGLVREM